MRPSNKPKSGSTNTIRVFAAVVLLASLSACALNSPTAGVSMGLPLGRYGNIGVGINSDGTLGLGIGVGKGGGQISIGTSGNIGAVAAGAK